MSRTRMTTRTEGRFTERLPGLAPPATCNLQPAPVQLLFAHANSVGHPAFRRVASGKLFRDDEAGHRTAGTGRGVLFHRELPFDDVAVRRRATAQEHPGC